MSQYHPFKRSVKTKSSIVHRWSYSYTDPFTCRKVQKVCPFSVHTAADAYAFISTLPDISSERKITVAEIARNMYIPGSDHLRRLEQFGKKLSRESICQNRRFIEYIIETFGTVPLDELQVKDVANYLMNQDRSGSWKNSYIETLGSIYKECTWHTSKIITKPIFPRFARNSKKADIFTTQELNAIFNPEIWECRPEYLLFLCMATCGLRLGEARAIRACQFDFNAKTLIIDGFCKRNGERTNYNKKGSNEDTKLRVVVLPDITGKALNSFIEENGILPNDYVFSERFGLPLRQEYLETVLRRVFIKADIKKNGRKLVPHSFRFTYVTRMRRNLEAGTVQQLAGHSSVEMTDYYTRAAIPEMKKTVQKALPAANSLFE